MTAQRDLEEPRLLAGVDLIRRTGSRSFELRCSDDPPPIVWIAVSTWPGGRWEAGAGHSPVEAVMRLCDQVIDGGMCTTCGRISGFEGRVMDTMPAGELVYWYQYDPGTQAFVRGCA